MRARNPAGTGLREKLAGSIDALLCRYVALAGRRAALLTLLFLVVALLTALPLSRLGLRTDMAALLPDQHPAVVALRRIEGRMRSMLYMFVALRGPSAEQTRRCLQALQPELEQLTPAIFSEVQLRPRRDIPDFIWRNRWLYAPLPELERADELTERAIARRTQPLLVDLEDDDPEAGLRALRKELESRLPVAPAQAPSYFEATADGEHYMAAVLWRRLAGIGSASDREAVQAVRAIAAREHAACKPGVRLELGGQLVISQEEQDALREDLTLATGLCTLLVLVAIYLHFRRPLLVILVGAPAVLAVLLAMSVASVTVHALNVNSAFLLSIILGNGINPAIIVLSRYGEERGRGAAVEPALSRALSATLGGIGAAMASASIAYGCLALTSFRGFSQFGLIGGVGMLLSFVCTLLMLPPLVALGEQLSPGLLTPRPSLYRWLFARCGRLVTSRPRLLAAASLLSALLAGGLIWRYAADPLEWDFSKLRAQETPGQRVEARLNQVGLGNLGLGYVGTNGVLRVDDEAEAEPVAAALRQRAAAVPEQRLVRVVRTLRSFLPEQQDEKLAVLKRLRARLDRHRDLLSADELRLLDATAPPASGKLRALTVEDLPLSARQAFTEVDGQRGRLIGIDYDPRHDDWDGHQMLRMADLLSFTAAGKQWVVAGAATVFGGMLDAILHDAPRVSLAAFLGVAALIVVLFGLRGAVPVLLALGLGVLWMGGAVAALGLKINYMNFVALPITLGIGADYAVNIWSRWQRNDDAQLDPGARMATAIAETGTAVALCSLTTIIGYSSLLLAGNRALRSFGLMADLGEICCLLAALVGLPALVRIFR